MSDLTDTTRTTTRTTTQATDARAAGSGAPATADVTVVMPAKDRAGMIGRALASVAAQSVQPRHVVVIDDGSTDGTADVARAAGATVIRLEQSGGSGPARNLGILAATTTWIAFLDSDDAWEPDHLSYVLSHLGDHVLVAAPGQRGTDLLGNSWGKDLVIGPRDLLAPGSLLCTSGTVVSRAALVEAGLFRDLRRAQDLDLWLRVLEVGTGLALSRPTFTYVVHDGQAINDRDLMRQCFDRIITDCTTRPWYRRGDADRAYTRFHWDDLRAGMRARERRTTSREVGWFATRPHTWPVLTGVLRQRRRGRRAPV